ncbi:acetyl-CoA carboxylase biotin carboxyl carrier protein [Brenneria tiliae]|uniref:Acetyl-CoA carboxylase biotin carboxyl carrier protein subunit n=1 Tax=Brenneria tiliae TaxID=2914984 RepID=A0ABT0MXG3_9GAMM|nr:biotin/lipoyl-containing protein [Brenneria tiliae]MCL2894525.1 acetyl-CoA carboxylase biotin carboxyl carrier protein subunit [Brenneria tiliae]
MLAIAELRQIASRMNQSGLRDIEIVDGRCRVRMRCDASRPAEVAPTAAAQPACTTIAAPRPGIVWFSHPLNGRVIAEPGATVAAGELVALLGVGHLLLPVRSSAGGTVRQLCVADGCVVEYGTELMTLSQEP